MRSELWKSASGIATAIFGLALVVSAIRLGTDPELADTHRAAVAVAFTPAGVLLLVKSHRLMRRDEPERTTAD